MKIPFFLFTVALQVAVGTSALAEKADRSQPMNIEADALRYDDVRQISVFSGKVVLSKGSIQIRGAQLEVRQDPQGFQFGVVTGTPDTLAFFRQKRDGVDETIEGEAETISYDGRADTVRFEKKAQLRRYRGSALGDEITGGVIVYENLTDRFSVDGSTGRDAQGSLPTGRVRALLNPKQEVPAGGAAPTTRNAGSTGSVNGGAPK
jgi:lipopolysaccharide export system protein LptA